MGLTFDTFVIFKEALKLLITKGDDYDDYDKLIEAIRNIKTTGCTGSLSFSPGTNNRVNMKYSWVQVVKNDSSDSYSLQNVYYVDR